MNSPRLSTLFLVVCSLALGSCKGAYYSTMERFGVHKREILVSRVEDARTDQAEAQEQFISTYDTFKSLTNFEGGELEDIYDELKGELEDCEDRADDVSERIAKIETVALDLFEEWREEILSIENKELRKKSKRSLADSKERYEDLIAAMKEAEQKMYPVLTSLRDHVTFLKHNLNAQAIGSLEGSLAEIESEIESLIDDMQDSINKADSFLQTIEPETGPEA